MPQIKAWFKHKCLKLIFLVPTISLKPKNSRVLKVFKTFLPRPRLRPRLLLPRPRLWVSRSRPRLWTSRPRPRPRLFSQDQGRTLLRRPLNRLPYICSTHKMNPTVYTQSHTTHRCRGADFSFQWRIQDFKWGWGANRGEWVFLVFFVVVNIVFLRILAQFFHKPHCLSWQMN